ncbi:uncharacterized protein LOC110709558 [Chenopodium quinoa]|uniref:uncharacterized protein LOC110709558 n=1 Tax=Chenopodium quinoa TaxID=63459 RepID=UPI000B772023|nr:uncharacterized protein LOC110709558 [Chenopodium quinoa]
MKIPNPNPPPTPIIIDISSDDEEDEGFVQVEQEPQSPESMEEEDDPEFDPGSYKQSTDKKDNLADVTQQLARNLTNNVDAQGDLFKKVAQSKPPTYQGEPDPTILENWLREFEKLFRAVWCPETSKVGCATYYLRDEADLWWKQNEATIKALPGFNWTMFQEKVRDKFYPSFLQKQKAEEFSNLAMGNMSVTEYYTKFIELSRFAKESVSTEKSKARKFESGLTADLQLKLYGQGNNRGARHFYCKKCKNDHPGRDCDGNLVTCRACNKLGHREYECFSKDPNRNKQENNQEGAQRNFQGSDNYSGNKGAQQNAAKTNNNSGNNQQKGGVAGKLNVMSKHEADSTRDVITSNFYINSISVKVLFDSGATFFISKAIVSKLSNCLKTVDEVDFPIVMPTGEVVKCNKTFKDAPLEIEGKVFLSDLIEFGLSDFDVNLGMDWLSKYSAEISCRSQKVKMTTADNDFVTYWMPGETKCPRIISVLKLAKYIKRGIQCIFVV